VTHVSLDLTEPLERLHQVATTSSRATECYGFDQVPMCIIESRFSSRAVSLLHELGGGI
jgi:hypothetical protein